MFLRQHSIKPFFKVKRKLSSSPRILFPPGFSLTSYSRPLITESDVSLRKKKKNLLGLLPDDLAQQINVVVPNARSYTHSQIWNSMYKHGSQSFDHMSAISKSLQCELNELFRIDHGEIKLDSLSTDGTRKFLICFGGDPRAVIETVVIPEEEVERTTLCLSSQIGCSLSCKFCHTGTQKLLRNLDASEIVGQYMIAAHKYKDFPVTSNIKRNVTNLVFMGQGEPLYNWKNVSKAVRILTDPTGISFPKAKITISTSGIVPLIPSIASELGVSLAISLHATNDRDRDALVPINKQYPIAELLLACKEYTKLMGRAQRRITFEYVMLDGVNDSIKDAAELARLLKELPAHVNLIPFNPWPGATFRTTPPERINKFATVVMDRGIHATVRKPRGRDILAACGQLKSNFMTKSSAGLAGAPPSVNTRGSSG